MLKYKPISKNNFSGALSSLVQMQLKYDAPYAWFLRNVASINPIYRKQDINRLDQRLESFLKCYLLSHSDKELLLSKINISDWGAIYIVALVSIRTNDSAFMNTAINEIKQEQQSTELRDALSCLTRETAEPLIHNLLCNQNPLVRAAAIESSSSYAMHFNNDTIINLFNDTPFVIVAVLKFIGATKLFCYKDNIESLLSHDDEGVRFQAAFTGSLLNFTTAVLALQYFCFEETEFLRKALSLVYLVINESEISSTAMKIQKSSYSPRIKAYNLAMAGLPDYIPLLIEWMNDPEYAPLAGEAFSFITGVDIEEDDLSLLNVELCESREAPLSVKRKKDRWTENYEYDLPWPDPELVSNWWQNNEQRFQQGTRYLNGKTLTDENLRIILNEGTQTQRHYANLILAVRNPNETMMDLTHIQLHF